MQITYVCKKNLEPQLCRKVYKEEITGKNGVNCTLNYVQAYTNKK